MTKSESKFEIGTAVKIKRLDIIGHVASFDHHHYQVEHTQPNGFLVRTPYTLAELEEITAEDTEAKNEGSPREEEFLVGSSVQPAKFILADGSVMLLGDVVRRAYEESLLKSVKDFNSLSDKVREAMIEAIVDTLDLAKPEKDGEEEDETAKQNADAAKAELENEGGKTGEDEKDAA